MQLTSAQIIQFIIAYRQDMRKLSPPDDKTTTYGTTKTLRE